MNLTINITDVNDALTFEQIPIVRAIFSYAEEFINNGGRIIIRKEFISNESLILAEFTTIEEIQNWKNKLNEIQTSLNRENI